MPTLYDNFERVRQYIDQHQADVDLSSYVSKDELSAQSYATTSDLNAYLPLEGGTITGRLVSTYYNTASAIGGIDSYSSVIVGGDDRNSVTMVATRRLCGDTSYAAAFFTNSDGRSKFTHKTKTGQYAIGGSDDAFMCFNAYGFKIAYSGEQGVGATTEYEILHEGNIGNLGYLTEHQSLNSYVLAPTVVSNPTEPYRIFTNGLGANNQYHHFYPLAQSYAQAVSANVNAWASVGTVRNYVEGRLAEIEASYVTSSDLPIINENIIPKETNTYTLGDSNNFYKTAYSYNYYFYGNHALKSNSTQSFLINIAGNDRYAFNNGAFMPVATNRTLGTSNTTNKWLSTYTTNLYTDTAYLQDTSYTKSIVPAENNAYTLGNNSHFYNATYSTNLWLANNNRFSGSQYTIGVRVNNQETVAFGTTALRPASNNGCTLGTSSNKWAATYTSNLYADNIHNFIWTGTSAEYAALDNYTTYQIYMIKEA